MKIGIDARLPAYQMGGISRYVLSLIAALAELDDNARYVVYHSAKDSADYCQANDKLACKKLWTPCHHRYERWLLSLELLANGLDIFHSPDFIPPFRAARRHVITVHDLNFVHYPQFLTAESHRYYAEQISWAVNHADHIIADSEHTRQDLIGELGVSPMQVTTVHLAADPSFRTAAASTSQPEIQSTLDRHGLQTGFILFVGTIEPRKNLPLLLEAYATLREQYGIENQLVIAGRKGWLYDEVFKKIDALALHEHVRHIQSAGDDELAHLYLSAGLLALPSHYEGFGLPVLEAMHCGCPVISSDRASLPEVVGKAGILLPPSDPDAWATAMNQVLTDENTRQRMKTAGLVQASHFSWERTAAETRRIYERLI